MQSQDKVLLAQLVCKCHAEDQKEGRHQMLVAIAAKFDFRFLKSKRQVIGVGVDLSNILCGLVRVSKIFLN